eukprot:1360473-Amorphochlora_amoeboformis.AAC.3
MSGRRVGPRFDTGRNCSHVYKLAQNWGPTLGLVVRVEGKRGGESEKVRERESQEEEGDGKREGERWNLKNKIKS